MVLQLFVRLPEGAMRACQAQPGDSVASVSGLKAYEAANGAAPVREAPERVAGGSGGRWSHWWPSWPLHSSSCFLFTPELQRVVCGGRTLDPHSSLAAAGVPPGATLELLPRLLGGGGDGGSTGAESRSCYLEMYAGKKADKVKAVCGSADWPAASCRCVFAGASPLPAPRPHMQSETCPEPPRAQVNPEEERLARWTTCQLSGMPLQPPCVADELGSLFNKDAVLQARGQGLGERPSCRQPGCAASTLCCRQSLGAA